jgi:hypothetical protein
MNKVLTGALAAVTLAGVMAPAPAEARPYGYGHGHDRVVVVDRHHRRGNGDAVAAGIAGLAIGAIIGSAASQPRYAPPPAHYYGPAPGYYSPPPAYYAPRWCRTTDWVWDPYLGRRVRVEQSYRC